MPRVHRWQRFSFDPAAVLYDPAYIAMSIAARGAYFSLICHAWLEKEPGVMLYTRARFAALVGVSESDWLELESQVGAAFEKSQKGVWKLPLMCSTYTAQNRMHKLLSKAGKAGATARIANAKPARPKHDMLEPSLSTEADARPKHTGLSLADAPSSEESKPTSQPPNGKAAETLASSVLVNETAAEALSNPAPASVRARPIGHGPACACELCWQATFHGAKS